MNTVVLNCPDIPHTPIGHGGHEAADFTLANFPAVLTKLLESLPQPLTHDAVSSALSESLTSLDALIRSGLEDLFPKDLKEFEKMSDDEVDEIVSKNHEKLLLGMRGTTALVTLVDEKRENLWIANVGDCEAGM